ncbi:MAG: hypothetical protein IKL22_02240 [Lachnospiraceae bacterium]|nr:hypothetical protein [Lachnospiraceae bacterium]
MHRMLRNNDPYYTLVSDENIQEALMYRNYMQAHQYANNQVNAKRIADYIANEAAAKALAALEKELTKKGFK